MPDKKDRDSWWAFLAGMPESDWNPPKKVKKTINAKKQQTYNSGLRTWPDDPPQEKSWQNHDEGEVEQVLRVDPAESLPSPVGTPLPSDSSENTGQLPSSSYIIPAQLAFEPREPTTRILKLIDEVRSFLLCGYYNANAFSFSQWPCIYSCTSRTGSTSIFRHQIPPIFRQNHMLDGFFLCYPELKITSLQTTRIFYGI